MGNTSLTSGETERKELLEAKRRPLFTQSLRSITVFALLMPWVSVPLVFTGHLDLYLDSAKKVVFECFNFFLKGSELLPP